MGYLDNSGDIIVDAVLTDTGRYRLSKGDGSFRIVKFALSDDEIDYGLFDRTNINGTAYYDLSILQTPVLEAFTNNASSMKSKLITIAREDLLYLPKLVLNTVNNATKRYSSTNVFLAAVDEDTVNALDGSSTGILNAYNNTSGLSSNHVRIDQGLMSGPLTYEITLSEAEPELLEGQYIIEMDNRLGMLIDPISKKAAEPQYIDDDGVASYYLSKENDSNFVSLNDNKVEAAGQGDQVIVGPRGTILKFMVRTSINLQSGDYWFDRIGGSGYTVNTGKTPSTITCKYIDTVIKISGFSTGASMEVPIRYIKKTA